MSLFLYSRNHQEVLKFHDQVQRKILLILRFFESVFLLEVEAMIPAVVVMLPAAVAAVIPDTADLVQGPGLFPV